MALYASADGTNWTNSTNWLSDAPLSDWYGVITDSNGLVIELNLSSSGLSGEIPSEFGELVNLRKLSLGHNNLTGAIPPQFGSFTNLKYLSLNDNSLTGQIPRGLGYLLHLTELRLSNNNLIGEISAELGNLATLEWLFLDSNRLAGEIPPKRQSHEFGLPVSRRKPVVRGNSGGNGRDEQPRASEP